MRLATHPVAVARDASRLRRARRDHPLAGDVRRTDAGGFWAYWARRQVVDIPRASSGDAVAVLLVHGRPWTLQTQIAACLQARRVGRVIVSCNAPDASLDRVGLLSHPRVELRTADPSQNQLRRVAIAAEVDADRFVLPDDDLYVTPGAIDFLCRCLDEAPETPCGIIGQNLNERDDWDIRVTAYRGRVDILNCIYALTGAHARRALALADELGWSETDRYTNPADDLLMSFAGDARPVVHGLSFIRDPAASGRVATFRSAGFHESRRRWIHELRQLTGIPGPLSAE